MGQVRRTAAETALIVIDMEKGYVLEESPLHVPGALATIPACKRVINASREHGIPVFYVKRIYRNDGSDIEISRWKRWIDLGRPVGPGSSGPMSGEYPDEIKPRPGDYLINKPRWSAFFRTDLDLILRRLGINTVVLIGTTTPNCIRTTAFEALMLDFETVVITDATSSATAEIQQVNLGDMERAGVVLMTSERYAEALPNLPTDKLVEEIRARWMADGIIPQPIEELPDGGVGWIDRW